MITKIARSSQPCLAILTASGASRCTQRPGPGLGTRPGLLGCFAAVFGYAEQTRKMGRYGERDRDREKDKDKDKERDRGEKSVWTPKGKREERPEMMVRKRDLKDLLEHKKQNILTTPGPEAQFYNLVTIITIGLHNLKSPTDLSTLTQPITQLKQKLASPDLPMSLTSPSLLLDPSTKTLSPVTLLVIDLCNKLKSAGLAGYDVEKYRVVEGLCRELWGAVPGAVDQLAGLAERYCLLVRNWRVEHCRYMDEKKAREQAQAKQQSQPKPQQGQQSKQPQLQPKPQPPLFPQIPTLALSTLLLSLPTLPSSQHPQLLALLLSQLHKLSPFTICIFMLDSLAIGRKFQVQFLKEFYAKIGLIELKNGYRFAYMSFLLGYLGTFAPLYPTMEWGKRDGFQIQTMAEFQNLYNFTKLLALQYKVAHQTLGRNFLNKYNRKISFLDMVINDRKLSLLKIMKLYNLLARVYPMGTTMIKQTSTWREFKVDRSNIDDVREFLIHVMANFKPHYIYSIEERPTNEISYQVLQMVNHLSRQVIKLDPQFIIETSALMEYIIDYNSQYSTFLNSITKVLVELASKLEVQAKGVEIVLGMGMGMGMASQVAQGEEGKMRERKEKIVKLVNFMFENQIYVDFKEEGWEKIMTGLYDGLMKLDDNRFEAASVEDWKFLFQICSLLKNNQPCIINIYKKFCEPYIRRNQTDLQKDSLVRRPKLYEQYLLRIASLFKNYIKYNETQQQLLTNFINSNFIYTAKSVLKNGVFQVLRLFQALPEVNPEIYAYLYSNLSSFIIYSRNAKKFYLKRGKNFCNDRLYLKILTNAANNCNLLKNIQNKDRLNILKTFMLIFWKKLSSRQIAQLLIIIGNPTMLSDKLKDRLQKNVTFSQADISGLDLETLSKFKLQNKKLMEALSKSAPHLVEQMVIQDMALTNSKSRQELETMFKNHLLYEDALETQAFTNESLIPAPETADVKVKMIYVLLRIVDKIRRKMNFSIDNLMDQLQAQQATQKPKADSQSPSTAEQPSTPNPRPSPKTQKKPNIDFSEQVRYIRQNNLVKLSDLNEFKLDNIEVQGHNEVVEGWNIYDQSQNLIQLESYSNFGDSDSNPYERVLLVLNGNYGLIKNLVKKQGFNPEVLFAITGLQLEYASKGSLIEINEPQNPDNELYIFCSKPANYKLHTIYAYILSRIGHRVCIAREETKKEEVAKLLSKAFHVQGAKGKRASEDAEGIESVPDGELRVGGRANVDEIQRLKDVMMEGRKGDFLQ